MESLNTSWRRPSPTEKVQDDVEEGEPAHLFSQVHHEPESEQGRKSSNVLYTLSDGSAQLQVLGPKIARGTYGSVYRGIFQRVGEEEQRSVGVKLMCRSSSETPRAFRRRMYSAELKMSQPMLESPRIVHLLHSFRRARPSCIWLVMELADFDFFNILEGIHRYEPIEGLHAGSANFTFLLADVLEGLAKMHQYGFLHRDIKPENILVIRDDALRRHRAVIADLDFLCNTAPEAKGTVFACAEQAGTLLYQPPEFWVPELDVGHGKCDVFAAALTFLGITSGGLWGSMFEDAAQSEKKKRDSLFAELRGLVEEMADVALSVLRKQSPVLRVLGRMIHPDVERRCTAEECLEELRAHIEATSDAPGEDDEGIPHLSWRLGEIWPMAMDDTLSRFFRRLFRPWQ